MDTVILAASLISFFALIVSWLALPHGTESTVAVAHGVAARA